MPRRCSICRHPQHQEIAVSLLRNGTRETARRFQVSLPALDRHKKHLPSTIVQAQQSEGASEATSLLARIERLIRESENIAAAAKLERDWPAATSALREARSCLELLGRLGGELDNRAKVRIGVAVSLNAHEVGGETEAELEIAIAQRLAAATNNFDPQEIARLSALVEAVAETTHAWARHDSPELLHSNSPI